MSTEEFKDPSIDWGAVRREVWDPAPPFCHHPPWPPFCCWDPIPPFLRERLEPDSLRKLVVIKIDNMIKQLELRIESLEKLRAEKIFAGIGKAGEPISVDRKAAIHFPFDPSWDPEPPWLMELLDAPRLEEFYDLQIGSAVHYYGGRIERLQQVRKLFGG